MSRGPIVQKEKKVVLDELVQRKLEVLADIRIQKDVINQNIQNIIHPFNNVHQTGIVSAKRFSTGIAIIDGALVGYSIIKRIKNLFRRKRR